MKSFHHLTAEYIAGIVALGATAAEAMRVESFLLQTLEQAERRRRAAELLPKIGADKTARIEHCCRKTAYNRAKRARIRA